MKVSMKKVLPIFLTGLLAVSCSDDSSDGGSTPPVQNNPGQSGDNSGNQGGDSDNQNGNDGDQQGVTDPKSLFVTAIATGDLEAIDKLMKDNAGSLNLNESIEGDKTPLMIAAEWGRLDVVNYFIEAGVDTKATDSNGRTAAIIAKNNGFNQIYRVLEGLEYSPAELNAGLMTAIKDRKIKDIQYFNEIGADIEALNEQGLTPLFEAILTENLEVVQLIINLGADPKRVVATRGREVDALFVAKNMIRNPAIAEYLASLM